MTSLLVVAILLLVSLAAMALVLFVIAPAHVQAQQNQTTVKTLEGLNANSINIQNTPAKKVHVGDIDVAYKVFGKGEPIILFNGASDNMDAWDSSFLKGLSSNHTVIVFDSRGIGNTTAGTKPYSMQQLANDTAGFLNALKIPKADVMGYSLGGHIAQAFTISYPEKVNRLILVASSCGGKDGIPKPPEFKKLQADIVNKSLHNIPVTQELKALNVASLGSGWIKLHPESAVIPANTTSLQQLKPGLPPDIANKQNNVGLAWDGSQLEWCL